MIIVYDNPGSLFLQRSLLETELGFYHIDFGVNLFFFFFLLEFIYVIKVVLASFTVLFDLMSVFFFFEFLLLR